MKEIFYKSIFITHLNALFPWIILGIPQYVIVLVGIETDESCGEDLEVLWIQFIRHGNEQLVRYTAVHGEMFCVRSHIVR